LVAGALVLAGGEDMSSCFEQPMNNVETAAIKNNNFFIYVILLSGRILSGSKFECKP